MSAQSPATVLLLLFLGCGPRNPTTKLAAIQTSVETTSTQAVTTKEGQPVVANGTPSAPIDAIDIYDDFVANPEKAKKQYGDKRITVRGTVHKTIATGFAVVVHLRHTRDPKGFIRYSQDRIVLVFPIQLQKKYDMGFDIQFDNFGNLLIPWSEGNPITITGTPFILETKEGVPHISFRQARLE